jgi:hypothetical protein
MCQRFQFLSNPCNNYRIPRYTMSEGLKYLLLIIILLFVLFAVFMPTVRHRRIVYGPYYAHGGRSHRPGGMLY